MKFLLNLIGIVLAGALGYYTEPDLRPYLTGPTPPSLPEPAAESVPSEAPPETPAPAASPVSELPPEPAPEPAGDSFEPNVAEEPAASPAPVPAPEPAAPEKPMLEPISPVAPISPQSAAANGMITPGIQAMQESIRSGQVTEFTYDKVIEWRDEAQETVDGATYQTGVVTYEAETLLGMKRIQAKAFIQDGKVKRWVGLKTGVEIK